MLYLLMCWQLRPQPEPRTCTHPHTVDVESLAGDIVARYCPDCERTFYPADRENAELRVWTQQTGNRYYAGDDWRIRDHPEPED